MEVGGYVLNPMI